MFQIAANPTFDASLKIVGQGREQTLNVTFKHKTTTEYRALLERVSKSEMTVEDAVLEVVEKWDADMPLTRESITMLRDHQPGADWAILSGFGDSLVVARQGN